MRFLFFFSSSLSLSLHLTFKHEQHSLAFSEEGFPRPPAPAQCSVPWPRRRREEGGRQDKTTIGASPHTQMSGAALPVGARVSEMKAPNTSGVEGGRDGGRKDGQKDRLAAKRRQMSSAPIVRFL